MINKPSNPCTWYTDTDEQESFTYEPGSELFYFRIDGKDIGSSINWIVLSILVFANSEFHARDIIEQLLLKRLEVLLKYKKREKHSFDVQTKEQEINAILALKDIWIISPAPKNQVYLAQWASNTTIL